MNIISDRNLLGAIKASLGINDSYGSKVSPLSITDWDTYTPIVILIKHAKNVQSLTQGKNLSAEASSLIHTCKVVLGIAEELERFAELRQQLENCSNLAYEEAKVTMGAYKIRIILEPCLAPMRDIGDNLNQIDHFLQRVSEAQSELSKDSTTIIENYSTPTQKESALSFYLNKSSHILTLIKQEMPNLNMLEISLEEVRAKGVKQLKLLEYSN